MTLEGQDEGCGSKYPHRYGYRVYSTYLHIIHNFTSQVCSGSFGQGDKREEKAEKAKKALGSVATLNVDKEDETPAGNAPAPAGIVDIVNTATGESVMNDSEIVAVISAAVMAAQGGKTRVRVNYPSNDKLVVRPRKTNKR